MSLVPPADLSSEEGDVWAVLAPLAIEVRTLTRHTEPSFRLLCGLAAERRAVQRQIERDGRTVPRPLSKAGGESRPGLKLHPLVAPRFKLYKQVETLMARFCLAPFGKPVALLPNREEKQHAEFFGSQFKERG